MTESNGPSLQQYVETRFNLALVAMDKLEVSIDRRFDALQVAGELAAKAIEERFKHVEQLNSVGQENAKRAVDKAEASQAAHNVAANEWRGTLNDFKSTLVARGEFDRLSADFAAYRLEVARSLSVASGEKAGTKDTRDDSKWWITTLLACAALVLAIVVPLLIART